MVLHLRLAAPLARLHVTAGKLGGAPVSSTRRLWVGLSLLLAVSFAVLLFMGAQITEHAPIWRLHRDLIGLRREDAVFRLQRRERVDGAVLGSESFLLRFFGKRDDDRLLLVNLGPDSTLRAGAEPLLAPPARGSWTILWTSEHPDYGGEGVRSLATCGPWTLTAASALVLRPAEAEPR